MKIDDEIIKEMEMSEDSRIVTSNLFIVGKGLSEITVRARKLLYLAISQCRMKDEIFCTYSIPLKDFAKIMELDSSNLYKEAEKITMELSKAVLFVGREDLGKFVSYPLVYGCEYGNGKFVIRLHDRAMSLFLNLQSKFSKPLLSDFMHMGSKYSMALWHLFQMKMKSEKPYAMNTIEFYCSLEELRRVTGTENKLKQIGQFKDRVLEQAVREIQENQLASIEYFPVREGRFIIGFNFVAKNWKLNGIEVKSEKFKNMSRRIELLDKKIKCCLSDDEQLELEALNAKFKM